MVTRLLSALRKLLPFIAGIIALPFRAAPLHVSFFLERYLRFLFLFGAWALLRWAVVELYIKGRQTRSREILQFGAIVVSAMLTLGFIQLFRTHFEESAVKLMLLLLGLSAIATRLEVSKRRIKALPFLGLYATGISLLSFQMEEFHIQWQAVLFSLAVGAAASAVDIAQTLEGPELNNKTTKTLLILHRSLLFLAPTLIAGLVFFGQIPSTYLLVYLILLPASKLVGRFDLRDDAPAKVPLEIFRQTVGISVLFIVIIGLIGIVSLMS